MDAIPASRCRGHGSRYQGAEDEGRRFSRFQQTLLYADGGRVRRDPQRQGRQQPQREFLPQQPYGGTHGQSVQTQNKSKNDLPRMFTQCLQLQGGTEPDKEQGPREPSVMANSCRASQRGSPTSATARPKEKPASMLDT